MSDPPFYYSMVVDGQPLHPYQAQILLFTLEHFGKIPRERMIVQCTTRVHATVRATFVQNGYTVTSIQPYLDEAYCNKIAQLDYFLHGEHGDMSDACGTFLLDLDLAVLSPLAVTDRNVVWGKIVNGSQKKGNPPLPALRHIFHAAGVVSPDVVSCDCMTVDTLSTNLNGGFLYVPLTFVQRIRASWRKYAEFLFTRPQLYDEPAQRRHIDQTSFALMLAAERLPYRHLTANWNFPYENSKRARTYDPTTPVHVLHYRDSLDAAGLIAPAPNPSDPAIDAAADRVNVALGNRNDPTFFDLYKRYRAKQAIVSVPSIREPMFPEDFIARTRMNSGQRRRLILHVGTPKTGTTGLQRYLYSQRDAMAREGIWYPPPSTTQKYNKRSQPKHQQLVLMLRTANEEGFLRYVQEALRDMPASTHTVIMTTEGMYHHWWDYTPRMLGILRHLANLFEFEMCVWFREPVSFAASWYIEFLKVSDVDSVGYCGQDMDFDEVFQSEWFRRKLDYLGFYYEAQCLFGHQRVIPFVYSGDTVETFLTHYGTGRGDAVQASSAARRANRSLRVAGIRLMRSVNRWRGRLPLRQQRRVVNLVRAIDFVIGDWSGSFHLNTRQADLVNRYAGRGWSVVKRSVKNRPTRHVAEK